MDEPGRLLWHGTNSPVAYDIVTRGVRVDAGRDRLDFGKGFYTTTLRSQAETWARTMHRTSPALVKVSLPRADFSLLRTLAFVSADRVQSDDYRSFVAYCRQGGAGHGLVNERGDLVAFYDVVIGPLALRWQTRALVPHADQVSFHSNRAASLLNQSARRQRILL